MTQIEGMVLLKLSTVFYGLESKNEYASKIRLLYSGFQYSSGGKINWAAVRVIRRFMVGKNVKGWSY